MTAPDDVPVSSTEALRNLAAHSRFELLGEHGTSSISREEMVALSRRLSSFRLEYKFALDEVLTKIGILREEWDSAPGRGPIEHVKHRLKDFDSMLAKMQRLGLDVDLDAVAGTIFDIAGVRITCPYVEDVYRVADTLRGQPDLQLVALKDYIESPKPNGYRSLHLVVTVPVFLSTRTRHVPVEIQIRTIAMDFWASVEHEIRYKHDGAVPSAVATSLAEAAHTALELDARMTELRRRQLRDSA